MKDFVRINNTLIDPKKVTALFQDENNVNKITIIFDNGEKLHFTGAEAVELWKEFDEGGWHED